MLNQKSGSGIAGDTLDTQLNTTANNTAAKLALYGDTKFIFGLSEDISTRMIQVLQDFFQADSLGRRYNRKLGEVNKEVIIQDQFSVADTQQLPQVVVTAVPVDALPVSLGNKLGEEEYGDQLFSVYGGNVTTNVILEIYDNGKPAVCKLADIVFLSMMEYVKEHMQISFMTVQPQIRFSQPTKVNATVVGGAVYKLTLSVPVVAEWRQYREIVAVESTAIQNDITGEDTQLK
jgi:hypothetical protein